MMRPESSEQYTVTFGCFRRNLEHEGHGLELSRLFPSCEIRTTIKRYKPRRDGSEYITAISACMEQVRFLSKQHVAFRTPSLISIMTDGQDLKTAIAQHRSMSLQQR